MMATVAANSGLLPIRAWSRLLVACALSMLLHLALLLGISINPTGGVVNVVSIITARLEPAAPDTGPEATRAGADPTSASESERDRQKPEETRTGAEPDKKAESKAAVKPEPKAAIPAASSPSSGIEVPLIRDPTYYPTKQLDELPQPLAIIRPDCPPAALSSRINGRVQLLLLIDEFGVINDASIIEAMPDRVFEEATLSAFRAARFSPAQRQGHRVKSRVVLRVNYLCSDSENATR